MTYIVTFHIEILKNFTLDTLILMLLLKTYIKPLKIQTFTLNF